MNLKFFVLIFLFLLFYACNLFESKKDHPDEVKNDETTLTEEPRGNDNHDSIYTNPNESMAEFEGGTGAMMRYLQQNIRYPSFCSENAIEGKVYIEFVIDVDGFVTNATIKRSVHPELDREALRVVKGMPRWRPAINFGKPVRQKYVLPINFRIT